MEKYVVLIRITFKIMVEIQLPRLVEISESNVYICEKMECHEIADI